MKLAQNAELEAMWEPALTELRARNATEAEISETRAAFEEMALNIQRGVFQGMLESSRQAAKDAQDIALTYLRAGKHQQAEGAQKVADVLAGTAQDLAGGTG